MVATQNAQKIIVIGKDGERAGETFPRRAKQLVMSGRAVWEGEAVVRLTYETSDAAGLPQKEDLQLDSYTSGIPNGARAAEAPVAGGYEICGETDAELMRLARKKVAAKRRLRNYSIGVTSVVVSFFFFLIVFRFDTVYDLVVLYGFGALLSIPARYIAYYVRERRGNLYGREVTPLMREYDKLKRMRPEYVRDETLRMAGETEE